MGAEGKFDLQPADIDRQKPPGKPDAASQPAGKNKPAGPPSKVKH